MLADISPKTAGTIALIVQPTLALSIFLMLVRIILSWYPNVKLNKFPYSVAVAPTEPFLGPTRRAVPPIGGVDVAPVSKVLVSTHAADACQVPVMFSMCAAEGLRNSLDMNLTNLCMQIIWLAIFSFVNEILLGPQGILNLLQRQIEF